MVESQFFSLLNINHHWDEIPEIVPLHHLIELIEQFPITCKYMILHVKLIPNRGDIENAKGNLVLLLLPRLSLLLTCSERDGLEDERL